MSVLDQIYNKQFNKSESLIKNFEGELAEVLARINTLAIARLSNINATDILQFTDVWQEILRDSGYYALVDIYITEGFDSFYGEILESFEKAGLSTVFTAEDALAMDTVKSMKRGFFTSLADDAGKAVQKEIYRYALADVSINEMAQALETSLSDLNLQRYANTYARTAVQEYQQEVINIRSANIKYGVWVYIGVNDGKTRTFCKSILNRAEYYDDSEKLRLENDPEREFNCRHRFMKVTQQWAKENGYAGN
jgi:hypothetical protein